MEAEPTVPERTRHRFAAPRRRRIAARTDGPLSSHGNEIMRTIDVQSTELGPSRPLDRGGRGRSLLFALGASTLLFAALGWRFESALAVPGPAAPPPLASDQLTPDEVKNIEVFRRASASVVNVTNLAVARDRFSLNLLEIPQGAGSGFVWDDEGHVVTNFHVVQDSSRVTVRLNGHPEAVRAVVLGASRDFDLAVLELEDAPRRLLAPLARGSSAELQVGQQVYAIGNPFGLDQTLTTGIISGLGREITAPTGHQFKEVIQTDAAINPGNSGGPLLDSSGRLIGINTAIVSPSGAYAGIGFAVPVDVVKRVVTLLIRRDEGTRAGLGIEMLPERFNRYYGFEGVGIEEVQPDSAAARAGLRSAEFYRDGSLRADVIVALDGQAVRTDVDLFELLERHKVGDEVTVTVRRGDRDQDLRVRLQALQ